MKMIVYRSAVILAVSTTVIVFAVVLPTGLSMKQIRSDIAEAHLEIEQQYRQRQTLRNTLTRLESIRKDT